MAKTICSICKSTIYGGQDVCPSCGNKVNAKISNQATERTKYNYYSHQKIQTKYEAQAETNRWLVMIATDYPEHYAVCKSNVAKHAAIINSAGTNFNSDNIPGF